MGEQVKNSLKSQDENIHIDIQYPEQISQEERMYIIFSKKLWYHFYIENHTFIKLKKFTTYLNLK